MSSSLSNVYAYIAIFGFFYLLLYYLIKIATKNIQRIFPVQIQDDFMRNYGYSYDFVLVFAVLDEEESKLSPTQLRFSLKRVIDRLISAKLECSYFYSAQRDEIYVKIRASPDRLKAEASRVNYRLMLDPNRTRARTQAGSKGDDGKLVWKGFVLEDDLGLSKIRPYEYIYCIYDSRPGIQNLYKTYNINNHYHIFKPVDRIKLIQTILAAGIADSGAGLDLRDLLAQKVILAAMPIHDYDELKVLQKKWLKLYAYPWDMPLDDIRDYFGERIALYFMYLQHYVTMLILPAALGLISYAILLAQNSSESSFQPFFTGFMILWSTVYIEIWKRKQSEAAMRWGTAGTEEAEQPRPQYIGEETTSPIDGSEIKYFPSEEAAKRVTIVNFITSCMLLGVVCIVAGIFYFKFYLSNNPYYISGIDATSIVIGLFNAIVINVLNIVYINVAIRLNDYENHRLDTEYEDALIFKLFTFQSVNSFAALTYVSFIQRNIGLFCSKNDCILDAATTLSTVFLSALITRAVNEIFVRKLAQDGKLKTESKGLLPGAKLSPIEEQYILAEYDILRGAMTDYAGLTIQFGFTVLFVGAFPLATTLALISGYIQIRIDGWRLCQAFRRPVPKSLEDIGTWQDMIEIIGIVGVVFNFGLIIFTGTYLSHYTIYQRWVLFLAVEHIAFVLKYAMSNLIDDTSFETALQLERNKFLVSKVLDDVADDIVDAAVTSARTNIVIEESDFDYNPPPEDEE